MSVNAYLHTSILYGQWVGWDGNPLDQPPLFYNGLTEPVASLLSSISDEILNVANDIELKTEADMSHVRVFNLYKKISPLWSNFMSRRLKLIVERYKQAREVEL